MATVFKGEPLSVAAHHMGRGGMAELFDYRILGPLDVRYGGNSLSVTAPRERDLLALLLLRADKAVSAEELIDGLWGSDPPVTARTTLHNYLKRLRRGLSERSGVPAAITTTPGGYVLELGEAALDLREFERLTRDAGDARARGEHVVASARLKAALALWRGDALADSRAEHLVQVEAPRLNEARLSVFEQWIDAELRLSRHREVVSDIQAQLARHPLSESLHARLLVALFRAGRRGDALAAYQRARTWLVRDLGLEPGPELAGVHQQVLADDVVLLNPQVAVAARVEAPFGPTALTRAPAGLPAQLPPSTAAFTGRQAELRRLDAAVPGDRAMTGGSVGIGLITGQAGVGKTTLAVHWGHRGRDRFPDGQLYANLRGYDTERPARPIDVLGDFLSALGVAADQVPAEEERAAALYRSLCAGTRMLVVLDNARSAAQVRPLFPGSGGCLVLVTSRDTLGGLVARDGAVPIPLDVLEPDEAEQFLAKVVGEARVRAEPAAAAALTAACACLPLAIGITAAGLLVDPERTIADQLARIGSDRLNALEVSGDEQSAVRGVLRTSYDALPPEAARMYRLLALMPGADIEVRAAAALAGVPKATAADLLGHLNRTHLVREHAPGRHTFHDLLRAYAAERLSEEEGEESEEWRAALERLHRWYIGSVDAATRWSFPEALRLSADVTGEGVGFADVGGALTWLDAERANIVALVRQTAEHGPWRVAWTLADCVRPYMMQRAHTADSLTVAASGLAAAEADGHPLGQAAAHRGLSSAYLNQSAYDQSRYHDLQALKIYRRSGVPKGQCAALNSLALSSWYSGHLADALRYGEQSVETCRAARFELGEAISVGNLGAILHEMGRLAEAEERLTEALALLGRTRHSILASVARRNLGVVLFERGRSAEAVEALDDAAGTQRSQGSQIDLAYTLFWRAVMFLTSGDRAVVLEHIDQLSALRTGELRAESDLACLRGLLAQSVGNHHSALERFAQARELARRCDARTQELRALLGAAESALRLDRLAQARAHAEAARAMSGDGQYSLFYARALTRLAEIALAEGGAGTTGPTALAEWALAICVAADHPLGKADALLALGHARCASGLKESGRQAWAEALDLLVSLGAARASEARSLLAQDDGQ